MVDGLTRSIGGCRLTLTLHQSTKWKSTQLGPRTTPLYVRRLKKRAENGCKDTKTKKKLNSCARVHMYRSADGGLDIQPGRHLWTLFRLVKSRSWLAMASGIQRFRPHSPVHTFSVPRSSFPIWYARTFLPSFMCYAIES